jgi:hypothetical protein
VRCEPIEQIAADAIAAPDKGDDPLAETGGDLELGLRAGSARQDDDYVPRRHVQNIA